MNVSGRTDGRTAVHLVRVRVTGPSDAVDVLARRLRHLLHVAQQSGDYANRPPSTHVRRYLDILISDEERAGEVSRG